MSRATIACLVCLFICGLINGGALSPNHRITARQTRQEVGFNWWNREPNQFGQNNGNNGQPNNGINNGQNNGGNDGFTGGVNPNGSTSNTGSPGQVLDFQCARSCPHTNEFAPVCGSNNQTYDNFSILQCAGQCGLTVQYERDGRCVGLI